MAAQATRPPILYIVGGGGIGGMELHVMTLASRLQADFAPAIACLHGESEYLDRLRTSGVPFVDLKIPRLNSYRAAPGLRRLVNILKTHRPVVVHCYGFSADLLIPLIRLRLPRTRIISSRRGIDTNTRHQQLRKLTNRFADVVVSVSEDAAKFAQRTEGLDRHSTLIVPNGVEFGECATGSGSSFLRFGTLGNVKPVKGTDLLVDAFCQLPPSTPAELHIAGVVGGRKRDLEWGREIVRRAQQSPVGDRIHFCGFQADSRRFLQGLDVFVLPSRSEGMSNALLEAMALGLPCIATNVGSNGVLLAQTAAGLPGIVCDPESGSLLAAMRRMIDCPELRRSSGTAAREVVAAEYSLQLMVKRYADIYRQMADERAPLAS